MSSHSVSALRSQSNEEEALSPYCVPELIIRKPPQPYSETRPSYCCPITLS